MKPWPLRLKASLWAVWLGGVTLMLIGAILAWRIRQASEDRLDEGLRAEVAAIFASIGHQDGPVAWGNEEKVLPVVGRQPGQRSVQIEQPAGVVVYSSRSSADLAPAQAGIPAAKFGSGNFRTFQATQNGTVVRIAESLEPLDRLIRTLWATCLLALPVVLVSMGLGAWWLSRRVLRPVERLAEAAAEIDAGRSEQRLPPTGTNDEIGHLTDVLNAMFGRIGQTFAQARRFSADASHELKTPLTIIRCEVEAALRSGQLPPQIEKTMIDLLEETGRLISIVEGLLFLSQADAGKLQFDLQPVNLTTLLSEIVEDFEILADPRGIMVKTDFQSGVLIQGTAQFLRQVALNLFDNAIKYNTDGGEIRATLSVHNGLAVFTISNTGVPVPDEDRTRVFDRFHRADLSRDRSRGGHGLGLSICREIVRAHSGEIKLEPSPVGWTKFQVSFPLPSQEFTESAVRRAGEGAVAGPLANEPQAVVTRPIR